MSTSTTIKDVSDFFKTGDPERDSLSQFKDEWMSLSDEEREFFKAEVGKVIGKS
jgi:hypothetical protein